MALLLGAAARSLRPGLGRLCSSHRPAGAGSPAGELYLALGVEPTASQQEIRRAFAQHAERYDPFTDGQSERYLLIVEVLNVHHLVIWLTPGVRDAEGRGEQGGV
jgi:hypothetical protein